MGWDRTKFEATCKSCGHSGYVIKADDDWGRHQTTWIGFDNKEPNVNAVARKNTDARDNTPQCQCGKTSIEVGARLGDCDFQGNLHENS